MNSTGKEDRGENKLKKILSCKIIVLLIEMRKSEKNVTHISIVGKFVLFSVFGHLIFSCERTESELCRTERAPKKSKL